VQQAALPKEMHANAPISGGAGGVGAVFPIDGGVWLGDRRMPERQMAMQGSSKALPVSGGPDPVFMLETISKSRWTGRRGAALRLRLCGALAARPEGV
jgi:hypothetical protein